MAQEGRTLIFSYDYYPESDFEVVAQLRAETTVKILQTAEGETVPEISRPDDYTGHVIRINRGGSATFTTFMFLNNGSMNIGDSGSLDGGASMFSSQLNFLATTIN